jgi:hypothetical protein
MRLRNPFFPKISKYHLPITRSLWRETIRFICAVFLIDANAKRTVLPIGEYVQLMASAPQSQPQSQPQPQPTPEPHQPQPSTSDASVSEPDSGA